MNLDAEFYRALYRIRRFEEVLLENFSKGVFRGTTHTYLGQEANAVAVIHHIGGSDIVFSNHRSHGHFLAYGGDMPSLYAELMGKPAGVCGGKGGSQHLHWKNFFSNGVQGGIVPIATGTALAELMKNTGAISICFLGDGTLGQGVVYEALNMAALWSAPILFVVENNHIAQTTPIDTGLAGNICGRFSAFGIPAAGVESADVLEIEVAARGMLAEVRNGNGPHALVLHTYRFGPHSKGDDTRPEGEVEAMKQLHDPVSIHGNRLEIDIRAEIENEVETEVSEAFEWALRCEDWESTETVITTPSNPLTIQRKTTKGKIKKKDGKKRKVLEALNWALHNALDEDDRVVLLGEDILDPYGGAFKVTRGLSAKYPEKVIATPISEAGIVGIATGMALRGLRPIVEIMFGDFLTLTADQIINHLTKFRWMYNEQVNLPVVIRTPMGGRRGYGPTHSQTLEKLFLGVPGLVILAPCDLGDPGWLLKATLEIEDPVLFVENKLLYLARIQDEDKLTEFDIQKGFHASGLPYYSLTVNGAPPPQVTLVAYGYMGMLAREALLRLVYEVEIFSELIILTQLSPFDLEPVIVSVRKTGRIVTIEEGTCSLGWGAEVISNVSGTLGDALKGSSRVAALDTPVPASFLLEEEVLPGVENIMKTVKDLIRPPYPTHNFV